MMDEEPPWNSDDWEPTLYRYEQIALWAAERIQDGRWPVKSLISEVQLQNYFGVGRPTIRHAMRILREKGLIVTKAGKGSIVISQTGTKGDILD